MIDLHYIIVIPVFSLALENEQKMMVQDKYPTGKVIRTSALLDFSQNFVEVAYFADDRQDLLNGINEFLDCSIVIPPSDVEGKDLLKTVASFQKQMLRKRKERENKKTMSGAAGPNQETKCESLFWFLPTNFYIVNISRCGNG